MKRLDKHQLTIITISFAIAAVFLIGYFPLKKKIKSYRFAAAQRELTEAKTQNLSSEIPLLKRRAQELSCEVGNFDNKLPLNRNFASLWHEITSVMDEYELTDRLVSPSKEIQGDKLCCIPIQIECSGGMNQVYSFFRAIEKIERQVKIEEISLKNDSQMSGNVKVKAKANVYYRLTQTI